MNWKHFHLTNNLLAWFSFAVAALTYLLTIGPTASLWDCAEFIVAANKLEVGHPPGAPFFMLVYNVVSHFTTDPASVGLLCNATSALLSALTILFLFWTITHLVRRVIAPNYTDGELSLGQGIAILGSGLVGALAYTFTDTFWFSAVEAEVYAFSSLFTAVVFWLMLKWEDRAANPRSDRWLVLIAYLMGLSIGVHLLNLLCIPAMALIYYYKRAKKPSYKGTLLALLSSFVLIVLMMYGVVQGLPKVGGAFDLFAVNTLGLSYNSGFYFYTILLALSLIWGIYETGRAVKVDKDSLPMKVSLLLSLLLMGIPFFAGLWLGALIFIGIGLWLFSSKRINIKLLHTIQMCLAVIAVGFSCYGVILVRAGLAPPMNQNDPSDAFSLNYYLSRSQYGSVPLFRGPTFTARPIGLKYKTVYKQAPKVDGTTKDLYLEKNDDVPEFEYLPEDLMLFPRIYSTQPHHIRTYNSWMGRAPEDMSTPSFGNNLTFFLSYQVGYMYFRYFGWNFIGRQNDLQGDGGMLKGRVVTGIPPIDNALVGPTTDMPDFMAKNKGYNVYFLLPFILGILGIGFQFMRGERGAQSFWIVFWLFFMTGLAIVVYVNQYPGQPRERDYSYAGSFYAFCIWIGFGVAGLWEVLRKAKLSNTAAAAVATALGIIVPIQMAAQNWDDHDRSGRTAALDFGRNYLESCEPNAILFCYGDNDTFPLWYCQEVEGIRRDIRVANLSYLGADWYIDQMKQQAYESAPLPLQDMKPDFYYGTSYMRVQPGQQMYLKQAIESTFKPYPMDIDPTFPTDKLIYPIDSLAARKAFATDTTVRNNILPVMLLSIEGKGGIGRTEMALLNMIHRNNWGRPICWNLSTPTSSISNMPNYLRQTGMVYQMVPMQVSESSRVETERFYKVFMDKFRFGGAERAGTYFDQNVRSMADTYRFAVAPPLAKALIQQGDTLRARNVMRKCYTDIRPDVVPYEALRTIGFLQMLYATGLVQEADKVGEEICLSELRSLNWYRRLSPNKLMDPEILDEIQISMQGIYAVCDLAHKSGSTKMKPYESQLEVIMKAMMPHLQQAPLSR